MDHRSSDEEEQKSHTLSTKKPKKIAKHNTGVSLHPKVKALPA